MTEVKLKPIPGTFGGKFEALAGDQAAGVVDLQHMYDALAKSMAESPIGVSEEVALWVYQHRGAVDAKERGIELSIPGLLLSRQAARELARVLLAYAGSDNQHDRWLVQAKTSHG